MARYLQTILIFMRRAGLLRACGVCCAASVAAGRQREGPDSCEQKQTRPQQAQTSRQHAIDGRGDVIHQPAYPFTSSHLSPSYLSVAHSQPSAVIMPPPYGGGGIKR